MSRYKEYSNTLCLGCELRNCQAYKFLFFFWEIRMFPYKFLYLNCVACIVFGLQIWTFTSLFVILLPPGCPSFFIILQQRYFMWAHGHYRLLLMTYTRAEPDVRGKEFPLVGWSRPQISFSQFEDTKTRSGDEITCRVLLLFLNKMPYDEILITSNVRSLREYQTSALTQNGKASVWYFPYRPHCRLRQFSTQANV